jgi:hypothetical protein
VVADEGGVVSGGCNLQLTCQGQSGHRFLVCGKRRLGVGRKNVSRIGRRGYACIGCMKGSTRRLVPAVTPR